MQLLSAGAVLLAVIQIALGYEEFLSYKRYVEGCVKSSLAAQNNYFAENIKQSNFETVVSMLNGIEYKCAFPSVENRMVMLLSDTTEQASFTWTIKKKGIVQRQLGKNLLKGPVKELLYPISLWSEEGPGDYWVGSIQLKLYFGDFVGRVTSVGWRTYGFNFILLFLLSSLGMFLVYRNYTKPNVELLQAANDWRFDIAGLKRVVEHYDSELVGAWKLYIESREQTEIERFELESQLRDLEGHVSKLERGQFGQSLNTERSSLDLKQSLFQLLVEVDHAPASEANRFIRNNIEALLGVCSNLHERALTESAEVRVLAISFSPRSMIAQVFAEFRERFARKHIQFHFTVSNDIPEFVIGDPEKIKRIIRNAFRRALMQPHVESIDFKASFGIQGAAGMRIEYELVAVPNQVASMNISDTDQEAAERLEKGPTPMLETLCHLMSARWSFASGIDGELRQTLNVPFHASQTEKLSQPMQRAGLAKRNALFLGVNREQIDQIGPRLDVVFGRVELLSSDRQFFEQSVKSKGRLAQTDVVIITDSLKAVPVIDMVATLKRVMPPNGIIVLIARFPQIGDARYYHDIGINAYLPELYSESFLMDVIAIAMLRKSESSGVPELTTRHTVIEQYPLPEDFVLPPALFWKARNTLLMVSQDLVAIELLRKACQRYRVRFVHFSQAFEAVEAFKYELFDAVLIDEGVQDIDSLSIVQLFKQVEEKRSDTYSTAMVALSRNGSEKEHEMFVSAGVTELFKKPVMNSEIALLFEQIMK